MEMERRKGISIKRKEIRNGKRNSVYEEPNHVSSILVCSL